MSFFDFILASEAKSVAAEAREFVKNEVDPKYIKAMDRDEVRFPREVYEKLAEHNLLGLRFPKQYGGRGLDWVSSVAAQAEIGFLGTACSCAYVMPDIVGEALLRFGTKDQRQKYLIPMLEGKLVSAERLPNLPAADGSQSVLPFTRQGDYACRLQAGKAAEAGSQEVAVDSG